MMTEPAKHGRLSAVPLLELLSTLGGYQKSGTLTLQSSSQMVTITIDLGSVRSVSTNDPALRIGQVLVQLGIITEEQIEQALALQSIATDPERIGEVLTDVGYVSGVDISQAMASQITSALRVMLKEGDGVFNFVSDGEEGNGELPPSPDFIYEPLILTSLFLAEYWLQHVGTRDADPSAEHSRYISMLEGLSADQQSVIERLIITHDQVIDLYTDVRSEGERVQKSVERVLETLFNLVTPVDAALKETSGTTTRRVPTYRVHLIDQNVDIWSLTDLTRNARFLLLSLLNGEDRLTALLHGLRPVTANPDRAIRELTAAGLIRIQPDGRQQSSSGGAGPGSSIRDRMVIWRYFA